MKINFFNLFRRGNILQDYFPIEQFGIISENMSLYPLFLPLEKDKVYAYSARFMIKPEDLPVVEQVVEFFFHGKLTQEKKTFADHDKILICYKFKEFNHDVVRLITNDNGFIACICEKKLEPPGPEEIFPDRDLSTYGSLQGDMQFWWDIYWGPFWSHLTEDEKFKYFERGDLAEDTIQFLGFHR
jgi:hypothetical protein